ncbi:cytochrome P450 [Pseudofrankia sp. BMG5.37]|nr:MULTISPECIES: cytochrome P450 [unclassified Pseudofrankia]MDT3440860.1 cytochrome P450 [Pseudofrankia sp. BMG5.37]
MHICLGMHLIRLEMRVGVNALLDRLPDLPDCLPVLFRTSA